MKRCPVGSTRKNGRCVKNSRTLAKRKAPRKIKRCGAGTHRNRSGRCVRVAAPRRKTTYRYAPRRQYAPIMYDYNYGNSQLALQQAAYKAPTAFHLKSMGRRRREQPEYWAKQDAIEAEAKRKALSAEAKLKIANVAAVVANAPAVAAAVVRRTPPGMGQARHNLFMPAAAPVALLK